MKQSSDALAEEFGVAWQTLMNYPHLCAAINQGDFRQKVKEKYPKQPELGDKQLFDLYTALLWRTEYRQRAVATPERALMSIEEFLTVYPITGRARKKLSAKLCNFRTSSLWDTLTELLVAQKLLGANFQNRTIEIEYPLEKRRSGKDPKDADVAVLSDKGEVLILIDALAPQRIDRPMSDAVVTSWVVEKYRSKFAVFCRSYPMAQVALVISLVKNEGAWFKKHGLLEPLVPVREPVYLFGCPGLAYVLVCTLRSSNDQTLDICPLAVWLGETDPPTPSSNP